MEKEPMNRETPEAEILPGETPGEAAPPAAEDAVASQLREIARMDPEMTDLKAILQSEAGPKFRAYVGKGLDFVDAYALAARERLESLREKKAREAARLRAAGKDHLSATRTQGQGAAAVPAEEMALYRALLGDEMTDAEIRAHYNRDRKRFGR